MKNYILTAILLTFVIPVIFAADFSFSAGGGGLLGYNFTRYSLECEGNLSGGPPSSFYSDQSMDRLNYGGFLFFDATYAVLSVNFLGGYNSWAESVDNTPSGLPKYTMTDNKGTGTEMNIGISLLGKYPFTINERFSLFPMLGAEYQISLRQWRQYDGESAYDRTKGDKDEDRDKNDNTYPLSAWNSFWINVGGGFDFAIS